METVADGAGHEHHYGYIHRKDEYLKRLRRIEGQARGLQRMVEDEKYCIDILTQVSAMTKALQAVSLGLLEEHLSHCVVEAARPAAARPRRRSARPPRPSPASCVPDSATTQPERTPMSTATYTVVGMTCGHCVSASPRRSRRSPA